MGEGEEEGVATNINGSQLAMAPGAAAAIEIAPHTTSGHSYP